MSAIPIPQPQVPRALVVVSLILVFDALTKAYLETPPWAEHYRDSRWQLQAFLGLAIPLALMAYRTIRLAAAILFAGAAGNVISALHGDIDNPFSVIFRGTEIRFNAADVALVIGCLAVLGSTPWIARDFHALRRRRGWRW